MPPEIDRPRSIKAHRIPFNPDQRCFWVYFWIFLRKHYRMSRILTANIHSIFSLTLLKHYFGLNFSYVSIKNSYLAIFFRNICRLLFYCSINLSIYTYKTLVTLIDCMFVWLIVCLRPCVRILDTEWLFKFIIIYSI